MKVTPSRLKGRIARVRKNLKHGLALAWAASPRLFIRYTAVGIFNAVMAPIAVLLGAMLVNKIAFSQTQALTFIDVLPIIIGIWLTLAVQRTVGAYLGYGRNLYVRRVELEAERRL